MTALAATNPDIDHRPPPYPTSLDTEETNVTSRQQPPRSDSIQRRIAAEQDFRHGGWAQVRARTRAALLTLDKSDARIERFDECGSHAWVLRHNDHRDKYRIASSRCHDRFCTPCARERAALYADNIHRHARDRNLLFVTLTIRHSDQELSRQLDRLIRSFRLLRGSKPWTSKIAGGCAFIEVKRSRDNHHWHPHLHVIAEGTYVPQSDLAHRWHAITGDSYIVDIRRVRTTAEAARYASKYAGKPIANSATHDQGLLLQCIEALQRRRLVFTFGSWRGLRLAERHDTGEWHAVAPLAELIELAKRGNKHAQEIIDNLNKEHSCDPTTPDTPPIRGPSRQPP